jgi:hypothetical protein
MLARSLPDTLATLLAAFTPCFTGRTLPTFQALVAGFLTQPGLRTVTGMLVGAGLPDAATTTWPTASLPPPAGRLTSSAWSCWTSSPRRWSQPASRSCWPSTTPCGTGLAARSTARPGIMTATAPHGTGPPGATAGWWSASSSIYRLCAGRSACRSWRGCGCPAIETIPRWSWLASWLTWSPPTSGTARSTWSATPPTSASHCKGCPPTSP